MIKYAYIDNPAPEHDDLEKGYAMIIVPNCNNGYKKFCNASGLFEEYYGTQELPDMDCKEKPTKVNVLMEAATPDVSSHANLHSLLNCGSSIFSHSLGVSDSVSNLL